MLAYSIAIALSVILAAVFGDNKHQHQYPVAYQALSAIAVILMIAGNFLFAFAWVTPLLRKLWKFAFPLVLISFVTEGALGFIEKDDQSLPLTAKVLGWITMCIIFFPSFRANFLLGYGSIERVRTTDRPQIMSDDPLRDLLVEIRTLRRSTQAAGIITIALIALLVGVVYFQVHFDRKIDSWPAVYKLADESRYDEALAVAERLIAKDPDNPYTRVMMGNLQLAAGRPNSAESSFTRAYELLPNEFNANMLNSVRKRIDETGPTVTPTP